MYKKMGGENWVWNINLTSALFAGKSHLSTNSGWKEFSIPQTNESIQYWSQHTVELSFDWPVNELLCLKLLP